MNLHANVKEHCKWTKKVIIRTPNTTGTPYLEIFLKIQKKKR